MASCQTAQWVSTAPYVRLTVTESSSTGNSSTLSWVLEYYAESAARTSVIKEFTVTLAGNVVNIWNAYDINGKTGWNTITSGTETITKTNSAQTISFGVSFSFNLTWSGVYGGTKTASGSITVPAISTYKISYNANGGSGAPSAQTKRYGTAITLSSTKPTRTGYAFQGWATSASGSVAYASGASYTANAAVTLYAVWKANTYTVSYSANGGTGAPDSQTKTYGVTLTLSSTKPKRTYYNFLGWATSASATTATYAAGGSYTANAAVTLHAVWQLAYVKPRIVGLNVSRCDASGIISDSGTCAVVTFAWECDKTVSSIKIEWESAVNSGSENVTASGTTGGVSTIIGNSTLSTDSTYTIRVIVTDSEDYSYAFGTLEGTQFLIDFLNGGNGAAVGKPAELEDVFDIGFKTRFFGGLLPVVLDAETDLNNVLTPNTYTGANISSNNYGNCPVESGTFTLLVESCGEDGQIKQTYCSCSKYKPERYSRFYYQGSWGDWFWANTDEYILYENDSGSTGTITLAAALSNFRYVEIYFIDNNNKTGGYTKIYSPNGKTACLSLVEASSATSTLLRKTLYTLSGTSITPTTASAGYIQFNSSNVISNSVFGTNYLKIVRVIGRA